MQGRESHAPAPGRRQPCGVSVPRGEALLSAVRAQHVALALLVATASSSSSRSGNTASATTRKCSTSMAAARRVYASGFVERAAFAYKNLYLYVAC